MINKIKTKIEHYKWDKAISILTNTSPEKIKKHGEDLVIPAIKRTISRTPIYQDILKKRGLTLDSFNKLEDLNKLPVVDKYSTFGKYKVEDLCLDGDLKGMKLGMTSSGFSGLFSYGILTEEDRDKIKLSIDAVLNYYFDIKNKKTFMINALPMGVKFDTSCDLANTSVREDMVFSFVDFAKTRYDKTIIVSDPHFIKKIIEDGLKKGLDWKKLNVSFVLGEDWFSNSFTEYLKNLVDAKYEKGSSRTIGYTMGITELDLNMFHSSNSLVKIRDIIQKDDKLREALFGKGCRACPELMHYYPHRTYLELLDSNKNGFGELVFTMLSPALKMALIRYNSKDIAKIFSYNEVVDILDKFNYGELAPDLKLPIIAILGRKDDYMKVGKEEVNTRDIKEALYRDSEVAGSITGYFKMIPEKSLIKIQLNKDIKKNKKIIDKINKTIKSFFGFPINIEIYEYLKFPYGVVLDYESKFKCF